MSFGERFATKRGYAYPLDSYFSSEPLKIEIINESAVIVKTTSIIEAILSFLPLFIVKYSTISPIITSLFEYRPLTCE